MNWKQKLKSVVEFYRAEKNLECSFSELIKVDPPEAGIDWPESLPKHKGLQEFYNICGGGEFGRWFVFQPLSRLEDHTNQWIDTLTMEPALNIEELDAFLESDAEYPEGTIEIIKAGQHIVFMNEGNGTPWILDIISNEVAAYYWKGGDWEQAYSFDDFMEYVMSPEPEEYDSGWGQVIDAAIKASL